MESIEVVTNSGDVTEAMKRFAHLHNGLRRPLELLREMRAQAAPGFNAFRLLGIHEREVKTHSAFLADLLNPAGLHGQGDLFLRQFLCGSFLPPDMGSLPSNNWVVRTEMPLYTTTKPTQLGESEEADNAGRVDILLRHQPSGTLIVIENKIYAQDQHRQMERYQLWLDNQRRLWPHHALLYLNLKGASRQGTDTPWFRCISYRDDVLPLLHATKPHIREPRVALLVQEYIDLLPTLFGGPLVQSDDPMIEYLSEPSNLRTLLEVTPRLDQVQDFIRRRFMGELAARLGRALRPWIVRGWRLEESHLKDRWYGVNLLPPSPQQPRYVFRIELERDLFHGVWARGGSFNESELSTPALITARRKLGSLGFDTQDRSHVYIGWRNSVREAPSDVTALLQLVEQRQEMLETATRTAVADFGNLLAATILNLEANRIAPTGSSLE